MNVYSLTYRDFFQNKLKYNSLADIFGNFADVVQEMEKLVVYEAANFGNVKVQKFVDANLEYARIDIVGIDGKHLEIEVEKHMVR